MEEEGSGFVDMILPVDHVGQGKVRSHSGLLSRFALATGRLSQGQCELPHDDVSEVETEELQAKISQVRN